MNLNFTFKNFNEKYFAKITVFLHNFFIKLLFLILEQ